MIVQFGTTSKHPNSTEIPTMTASYNCILKEGCSVISPVIIIDRKVVGHSYNTAYIADFGRYYWIRDIVYENARQYFYLECDVLASFKTAIGNSTQYVLRAASKCNPYIIDKLYPVTPHYTQYGDSFTKPWLPYSSSNHQGLYVMGIIGQKGVTYYGFTYTRFLAFMDYLMSEDFTKDILEAVYPDSGPTAYQTYPQLKMMANPVQYITSCMWMPIDFSSTSGTPPVENVEAVRVGTVVLDGQQGSGRTVTGYNLLDVSDGTVNLTGTLYSYSRPPMHHPQALDDNLYLDSLGFTDCRLNFPPFGTFDIDAMSMHWATNDTNKGRVRYNIVLDIFTGVGILKVYTDVSDGMGGYFGPLNMLVRASAQVGVPIPIVQVMSAGNSVMDMIAGTAASLTSGAMLNIGGAFSAMNDTVKSFYADNLPKASVVGSQGSVADLDTSETTANAYFFQYTWKIMVDEDNTRHGRPLYSPEQISGLSGFIQCLVPSISITGTKEESEQIESFMSNGFYYE